MIKKDPKAINIDTMPIGTACLLKESVLFVELEFAVEVEERSELGANEKLSAGEIWSSSMVDCGRLLTTLYWANMNRNNKHNIVTERNN